MMRMSFLRRLSLATLIPAAIAAAPVAHAASVKDGDQIGDWGVVCPKTADQKVGTCQLVQTQMVEQDGKKGRLLQLTLLPQSDKTFIMIALLPLGIHLPDGVAVKVDENEQKTMVLQRCTQAGCEAAMRVDAALIAQFKKGKSMKVGFNANKGQTMVAQASLKGLGEAIDKLR